MFGDWDLIFGYDMVDEYECDLCFVGVIVGCVVNCVFGLMV